MPHYHYTALARNGAYQHGTLDLPSQQDVADRLQRDGLQPVAIYDAEQEGFGKKLRKALSWPVCRTGGLGAQEVTALTRQLALMLGAGQDLDRALRYLVETTRNKTSRAVIVDLRDRVRDGGTLTSAMQAHPRSFSQLYIGLVQAGEVGGTLTEVLEELTEYLERERSMIASIRSAMIYPTILVVASVGAVVMLLTEILPQFVPLFQENGVQLPFMTRLVMACGDAVAQYGMLAMCLSVVVVLCWRAALNFPEFRLFVDRQMFRIPVLGGLEREIVAGRLTRTLGTLTRSGVALIPALQITQEVLGNAAAVRALMQAGLQTREGYGLARPLAESGLFPLATTDLLGLGEETSRLSTLALKAADLHEEQTRLTLQRLMALLVPAITILMGGIVAAIVSSLLLAMLSLNDLAR